MIIQEKIHGDEYRIQLSTSALGCYYLLPLASANLVPKWTMKWLMLQDRTLETLFLTNEEL